jgi:hypothetical protein
LSWLAGRQSSAGQSDLLPSRFEKFLKIFFIRLEGLLGGRDIKRPPTRLPTNALPTLSALASIRFAYLRPAIGQAG